MTAPREPAGSPVTAVRRTSRGPSAGFALAGIATAVGLAVMLALATGPGPEPPPSEALASIAASASPSTAPPTPPPSPAPAETVVVLRGVDDPPGTLIALAGCRHGTRTTADPPTPPIDGATIDAVASSAGRDSGWLFVPPGIQATSRVWLGDDLVELAHAAGLQVVAVDPEGEVWLGGAAGATRWVPIATPAGRTAWVMARDAIVSTDGCSPWSVPTVIAGQRSLTCSGMDVPACLRLLARARLDIAGLEYSGGDATVAIARCRLRSLGCFNQPAVVVATPAGWPTTTTELRAAVPLKATGQYAETEQSLLPDYVLDLLARPSLPLPVQAAGTTQADCSETLTGSLRGSPWDPRVAWVGDQPVVWPATTSAFFIPRAIVEVIGKTDGTTARAGDPVVITGALDAEGRFQACRMTLAARSPSAALGGETPAVTPGPPDGRGTGS